MWNSQQSMDHLVRNGDGDEVLFIHQGCGQLFCDYGHLSFHDGDYIVIPRATSWRIDIEESVSMLLIEATNSGYQMAERGLVGQHAIYDPAILEYARIDKAFLAQQNADQQWQVRLKARDQLNTITYPFNRWMHRAGRGT